MSSHRKRLCLCFRRGCVGSKKRTADSGIDVNKFTANGLLRIYQVASLTNYYPSNSSIDQMN
jgi:hypothetical protein